MVKASPLPEHEARALLEEARLASANAYAPYSDFPVGAAFLDEDGTFHTGCNVENASYGLTMCAERVALGKALSLGRPKFKALALWGDKNPHGAITPCGACRQVLAEFLGPQVPVIYTEPQEGRLRQRCVAELLPETFGFAGQD